MSWKDAFSYASLYRDQAHYLRENFGIALETLGPTNCPSNIKIVEASTVRDLIEKVPDAYAPKGVQAIAWLNSTHPTGPNVSEDVCKDWTAQCKEVLANTGTGMVTNDYHALTNRDLRKSHVSLTFVSFGIHIDQASSPKFLKDLKKPDHRPPDPKTTDMALRLLTTHHGLGTIVFGRNLRLLRDIFNNSGELSVDKYSHLKTAWMMPPGSMLVMPGNIADHRSLIHSTPGHDLKKIEQVDRGYIHGKPADRSPWLIRSLSIIDRYDPSIK